MKTLFIKTSGLAFWLTIVSVFVVKLIQRYWPWIMKHFTTIAIMVVVWVFWTTVLMIVLSRARRSNHD